MLRSTNSSALAENSTSHSLRSFPRDLGPPVDSIRVSNRGPIPIRKQIHKEES
jgi:hypothetical protein